VSSSSAVSVPAATSSPVASEPSGPIPKARKFTSSKVRDAIPRPINHRQGGNSGGWASKVVNSPSKTKPGTEFKLLAWFTYSFKSQQKTQRRFQAVAQVFCPDTGTVTLTVIAGLEGNLSDSALCPVVGSVYTVRNAFPRANAALNSLACVSVPVVYQNPTRAQTTFTLKSDSTVNYPATDVLQEAGLSFEELTAALAAAPDPTAGIPVTSIEGTLQTTTPHLRGTGCTLIILLAGPGSYVVSFSVWVSPAELCPGGVRGGMNLKIFLPVAQQGRNGGLTLKSGSGTVVTTAPFVFSEQFQELLSQPADVLSFHQTCDDVLHSLNQQTAIMTTATCVLTDILPGDVVWFKCLGPGCKKLVPDDGVTLVCPACGPATSRFRPPSSQAVFWFQALLLIDGVDYPVRFSGNSGPQLLKVTGDVWFRSTDDQRDAIFDAVNNTTYSLTLKVSTYQGDLQLMCIGALPQLVPVSSGT
jgi:hypothetical protein